MRTQDTLDLEDLLLLDESPDALAAMTSPDLRRYVDVDEDDDEDLGLRALLERPEALCKSLRRQLQ